MMTLNLKLGAHMSAFYASWAASLALIDTESAAGPAHLGEVWMVDLGGFQFPLLTGIFAAIGVLLARPLAPKREKPIGLFKNILVTVIMVTVAIIWVADARPMMLFAFVVSIGLGFSGYSLIEIAGGEVTGWLKRIFAGASGMIDGLAKKDDSGKDDT